MTLESVNVKDFLYQNTYKYFGTFPFQFIDLDRLTLKELVGLKCEKSFFNLHALFHIVAIARDFIRDFNELFNQN